MNPTPAQQFPAHTASIIVHTSHPFYNISSSHPNHELSNVMRWILFFSFLIVTISWELAHIDT